jgi:hypothetical protein
MKKFLQKKQKGQGVIEYAGALVIAAVLVAAVLAIGPDAIAQMFQDVVDFVSSTFDEATSAGG